MDSSLIYINCISLLVFAPKIKNAPEQKRSGTTYFIKIPWFHPELFKNIRPTFQKRTFSTNLILDKLIKIKLSQNQTSHILNTSFDDNGVGRA